MLRRILMVGPFPPTVGGITTCIENIVNSRLKAVYEFIPFTTSRPTVGIGRDVSDYSIMSKIRPGDLIRAATTTIYHLFKYPFVLFVKRPNLIHVHTTDYIPFLESSIYVLVARLLSRPTIIHIHATAFETFFKGGNRIIQVLVRKTLNTVDQIIVLSPKAAVFLQTMVPQAKISVVQNAIEATILSMNERFSQRDDSDKLKVLFLGGEEAKRKGFFDVIKAIPIVVKDYGSGVLFLFAGIYDRGKQEAINQAETAFHCIRNLGFLDPKELLKVRLTSDIYILPSYAEGLPIALMEAMAAGLPVVSTRVGSIPELVEEGVNGFLIDPGDYEGLAEKIALLGRDSELRQEMGEENIRKIQTSYSLDYAMRKLDNVYSTVIQS